MKIRALVATLLLTAVAGLAQTSPQQKVDPAKAADIRHLLDLVGTKKLAEQMLSLSLEQLKSSLSKALPQNERSQKIMDGFLQKFQARFTGELLADHVIPIYDTYLSAEDIKGLIQFYESSLGQRVVKVLPQIARESQVTGAQLGQRIAQDVLQELQQEYPELRQGQKPGPGNP
jgi:hypothetical protein